jgi:hypothetical protein
LSPCMRFFKSTTLVWKAGWSSFVMHAKVQVQHSPTGGGSTIADGSDIFFASPLTSCVHMPVSSSGNMKGLSVSDMSNMSASILRRLMWGRAREQFCTLSRVLHVCHEVIDELMINLQAFCGLAAFSVRAVQKVGL